MSDFQQALLISGGIAILVLATGYGRRAFTVHSLIRPLIAVVTVSFFYLRGMPTDRSELWLYAAGLGLGLACGAVATVFTGIERDETTGKVVTVCGVGFAATWLAVVAARLAFVWEADHNGTFRQHLGTFMMNHQLHETSIAPFFVIWALAMVVSRIAANAVRADQLPPAPKTKEAHHLVTA